MHARMGFIKRGIAANIAGYVAAFTPLFYLETSATFYVRLLLEYDSFYLYKQVGRKFEVVSVMGCGL